MSFSTTFSFQLDAYGTATSSGHPGDTLLQTFNVDAPTFHTAHGFKVEVSSEKGGPVLLQLGTVLGSDGVSEWAPQGHRRFGDTADTRRWTRPTFVWDSTTQQVELRVQNLAAAGDTLHVTCTSGE